MTGSLGDTQIDSIRLQLLQSKNITDTLFDLSEALQEPAFSKDIPPPASDGTSLFGEPVQSIDLSNNDHAYPETGWETAIIVDATPAARGTRWDETGMILARLSDVLSEQQKNISFVQIADASDNKPHSYRLDEAIEHIRTNGPGGDSYEVELFGAHFSSACERLRGRSLSVIYILPAGLIFTPPKRLKRLILQRAKHIREANITESGILLSLVVLEANRYLLDPLHKLAIDVNEDRAVIGTVVL